MASDSPLEHWVSLVVLSCLHKTGTIEEHWTWFVSLRRPKTKIVYLLTLSSAAFCSARSTSPRSCCLTLVEEPFSVPMVRSRWCSSLFSFDTSFLIPSTSLLWVCLALWSSSLSCRLNGHNTRWSVCTSNTQRLPRQSEIFSDLFHLSDRGVALCSEAPQLLRLWSVRSLSARSLQSERITKTSKGNTRQYHKFKTH